MIGEITELPDVEINFTRIAQINVEIDRLMEERANLIKVTQDDFFNSKYSDFSLAYLDWETKNK